MCHCFCGKTTHATSTLRCGNWGIARAPIITRHTQFSILCNTSSSDLVQHSTDAPVSTAGNTTLFQYTVQSQSCYRIYALLTKSYLPFFLLAWSFLPYVFKLMYHLNFTNSLHIFSSASPKYHWFRFTNAQPRPARHLHLDHPLHLPHTCGHPLWNFSSRNRVTPVSIQDGV